MNPLCKRSSYDFNVIRNYIGLAVLHISSLWPSLLAATLEATKRKSLSLFRYFPTSASVWFSCIKNTHARSALRQTARARFKWVEHKPALHQTALHLYYKNYAITLSTRHKPPDGITKLWSGDNFESKVSIHVSSSVMCFEENSVYASFMESESRWGVAKYKRKTNIGSKYRLLFRCSNENI